MNTALTRELLFAHLSRNRPRTTLTTLAVVASACVVVWVVSGYDALLGGFEDNAAKYLGRYDAVLLPPAVRSTRPSSTPCGPTRRPPWWTSPRRPVSGS